MTAISAFRSSDAVHVFSDGAWHDPATGKLCGIGTKVTILPEYNGVLGITGTSEIPVLLSSHLVENPLADLHSLADAMPDLVRTCFTRSKALGLNLTGRCEVVLAGWTENAGPLIHVVECHPEHGIFKGRAVERHIRPSIGDTSQMRFPHDGLLLLEKQYGTKCQQPGTFGAGAVGRVVGGFAQHTQIAAEGIFIKLLKRWPDEIQ
ncbi:hypothetical protein GA0061099_1005409 [Bradyrhizobium yuanmingense]|uniref:Uncharacterized protein n=1 Tax=Bradyrhizobium yuanmingense TaxID=108015 RepID=A0A1C3W800_9BRAD|nr:hypothetical protein [Bradyrhizobium yuanmingense]TWI27380.1 hypothetical protein IQ15_02915 [Bradyrhizobium yuanmingense]SCB36011.1 hypothetical protein GA0061099_1005409 [Bradyrhizobium yuanmingense]